MKPYFFLLVCCWVSLAAGAETNAPTGEAGFESLVATLNAATGADRKLASSNLYEFVQETIRAAEGTPGKEAANFLRTGNLAAALEELKTGRPVNPMSLNAIRSQTILALKGPTWPRPAGINVPYAKVAPVIDGHLDDPVWATAAVFTNSYVFNETNAAPCHTTYRILWDEKYLYFAFDCEDEDIVAPIEPRDAPIYRNDCVEMFILPEPRFRTYWELVVSPSGCIFDSIQQKKPNEWGVMMDPTQDIAGLKTGISIRGTLNNSSDRDKGYSVEVAVPFDQLPNYTHCQPQAGQTLSLMMARIDRNNSLGIDSAGQLTTNSTFKAYSFVPLLSWGHNIWNHPVITLVK